VSFFTTKTPFFFCNLGCLCKGVQVCVTYTPLVCARTRLLCPSVVGIT
jgi:hypothetical protein